MLVHLVTHDFLFPRSSVTKCTNLPKYILVHLVTHDTNVDYTNLIWNSTNELNEGQNFGIPWLDCTSQPIFGASLKGLEFSKYP